ncbi:hypothetical protein [Anthocerotibacter panamensis]|uniref:hypothetical protein n=1 Tax=Anthocerotibacter panamensis TaxID=2857077 RepID=UPI001C40162F|nr:hypothetical protein [Anthocerotibacter panamensis]
MTQTTESEKLPEAAAPAKRLDGATSRNRTYQRFHEKYLKPVFYRKNALDDQYYLDTTRVSFFGIALLIFLVVVAGFALFSLRSSTTAPVPTPAATPPVPATSMPAAPSVPTAPPPVPAAPVPATASPFTPAISPQATPQPPGRHPPPATSLNSAERAKQEALTVVQLRANNRTPYVGAEVVGAVPLPPDPQLPKIETNTAVPRPQENVPVIANFPVLGSRGLRADALPVTPLSSTQEANPSAIAVASQTPQLSASLTVGWTLLPPGNWLQLTSKNLLQAVGRRQDKTLFLATVKGEVQLDGRLVIPDGALVQGTLSRLDEALGRVYIQFQSLTVGTRIYPLRGASAWVIGSSGELAEGLVASIESPNYLGADLSTALGTGAAQLSRDFGQSVVTSNNSLTGVPIQTTTQSGDLSVAGVRAVAQGVSSVFQRQTQRSDADFQRQDSRGAIYTIRPGTVFALYLPEGI